MAIAISRQITSNPPVPGVTSSAAVRAQWLSAHGSDTMNAVDLASVLIDWKPPHA